jgi:hypothetical protein
LIFDVTEAGAGVEVFQPVEVVSGGQNIEAVTDVADGDQSLKVTLMDLAADAQAVLTVDMDDTDGGRQITVSGFEMAGATARVTTQTSVSDVAFDDTGSARVMLAACVS